MTAAHSTPPRSRAGLWAALAVAAIVVGVVVLTRGLGSGPGPGGLSWLDGPAGFDDAVARQQQTGQAIALYVETDWCPNCKAFKQNVLSDPDVQQALGELILVRLNPEAGADAAALARKLRVLGFPEFYVLRADGRRARVATEQPPRRFAGRLKLEAGLI